MQEIQLNNCFFAFAYYLSLRYHSPVILDPLEKWEVTSDTTKWYKENISVSIFSCPSEKHQDQFKSCYDFRTSNFCLAIQFVSLFKRLMIRFWLQSTEKVTNGLLVTKLFSLLAMAVYLITQVVSCQKKECKHKRNDCGSSSLLSNSTFVKHNNFYTRAVAIESMLKMKHQGIK